MLSCRTPSCKRTRAFRGLLVCLPIALMASQAVACPEGQTRGAFGWCYPNIGGTVGQTFEAGKRGDINEFAKGLGDISITVTCPACALVGQTLFSKQDREVVSTIVGKGLILQAVGLPPVLVLGDVGNTIQAVQLKNQQQLIIIATAPVTRTEKIYKSTTQAACMVGSSEGKLSAGWITPPVLVDVSNGKPSTFPDIDLQDGDVVSITAEPCPEANVKDNTPLTSTTLRYEYSNTVPGPDTRMKYFFTGSPITG